MGKISQYNDVPVPKLSDMLIGTSVGLNELDQVENQTYNFTLQQLLDLFIPDIPSNNLQGVLDNGNTATQDINLLGKITTTDLEVTNEATFNKAYFPEEMYIPGLIYDETYVSGTNGQVLSRTTSGVKWISLPPIFTPNLQQVLNVGNIASTNIQLSATLYADAVDADDITSNVSITLSGELLDGDGESGLNGQVLTSTGSGKVLWQSASGYTGVSPISVNNGTKEISISQADATHSGYLSSTDWNTFDSKQDGLFGTGLVKSTAGVITYITDGSADWNSAYNDTITSAAVTGTTTKTLTLNQRDGGTVTASWTDADTAPVTSVFGRTGDVVAQTGDYTTTQVTEGTNLYFTNTRSRDAISSSATGLTYTSSTGVFSLTAGYSIPTDAVQSNWTSAYNNMIISAAVTGTSTKTLTLNQEDGGTITASWSDTDTGLTSVGVSMPSAFSVSNSPLTSNGTIAITGAGTTSQYVRGDGSLATFPSVASEAQRLITEVYNETGATLTKGTVVYISSGHGNLPSVSKAIATSDATSAQTYGIVQSDITNNNNGFVVVIGSITNINTNGYSVGQALYLSSTVAGEWTSVKQYAPAHLVYLGTVVRAHPTQGVVEVRIQNGFEMDELHNVYAQSPSNNAILQYKTSTSLWTSVDGTTSNIAEGSNLYYLDSRARAAISLTTTGTSGAATYNNTTGVLNIPQYISLSSLSALSPLSYNNTTGVFSIQQASASQNGYLSSTDWTTFNDKANNADVVHKTGDETINGIKTFVAGVTFNGGGALGKIYSDSDGSMNFSVGSSIRFFVDSSGLTTFYDSVSSDGDFTGSAFKIPSGLSTQFLKADGSLDSSAYITKTSLSASTPLSYNNTTGDFSIQQANGSQSGYLSSTDWSTFNSKQTAGSYITSLTGEATASGPGAASVTLTNSAVTGKVLTGVNITGGSISATDSILDAFGKVQNQINGLIGGSIYQGTWNANTNTPALASGVGTKGYYYIVSVAGTTNLDGITDWNVGDWAIYDGTAWQQVDNTDAVVSVNGFTGAVSLTTANIPEATNLYYTDARARGALSFTAGSGAYNSTTGVITIPTNTSQLTNGADFITLGSLSASTPLSYNNLTGAFTIQQANTSQSGYLSSTDWNTFNNKTSNTGTVTSVGLSVPTGFLAGGTPVTTSGTLALSFDTGYELPTTAKQTQWDTAYTNRITSASAPLSISSNAISISQATTSTNGYLSSTDWNTFNNKQSALTNPVTGTGTSGYVPKFTGTSTIGNSLIYDNATNVGIGTTSPSEKLDVNGNIYSAGNVISKYTDGSNAYRFLKNQATGRSDVYIDSDNGLFQTRMSSGSNFATITANGFGVNNNGTYTYLHMPDSNAVFRLGRFGDYLTSYMMVVNGLSLFENSVYISSGNLGVGTTTANVKFVNSGGTLSSGPTLGSSTVGSQALLSQNNLYGMYSGVSTNGDVWHQVQRNDGNTAVYNLLLQPSGGNVGIGLTSPTAKLHVAGENNKVIASFANTAGATGQVPGVYIQAGTNSSDYSLAAYGAFGSSHIYARGDGNVGIGTTSPSYRLQIVSDSAAKPSTNTWTITSDVRVKENINPYEKGLETILAINPVTYDYNGKAGFEKIEGNIGIIAQDVIEVLPESISTYKTKLNEDDEDETELLNFNSHALTYVLINAIKEQQKQIEELKAQIKTLI